MQRYVLEPRDYVFRVVTINNVIDAMPIFLRQQQDTHNNKFKIVRIVIELFYYKHQRVDTRVLLK